MNNEVLDIYSDDLTDAEAESLFSTTKESKRRRQKKNRLQKGKDEKHGLTLRGHMMACRCMTICTSTAKNKFTVHVGSAGEGLLGRHITTEQEVESAMRCWLS